MAGTLDFEDMEIECPHCGDKITISICIDYNPKRILNPTHRGLSSGSTICPICKVTIKDEDLGE